MSRQRRQTMILFIVDFVCFVVGAYTVLWLGGYFR